MNANGLFVSILESYVLEYHIVNMGCVRKRRGGCERCLDVRSKFSAQLQSRNTLHLQLYRRGSACSWNADEECQHPDATSIYGGAMLDILVEWWWYSRCTYLSTEKGYK